MLRPTSTLGFDDGTNGGRASGRDDPESGTHFLTKARVLAVDDNEANLLALRAVLAPTGREVVTARSGAEAIALVEATPFAVVLLDVQMPGMGGLEAASRMKRL